jgi:hypothetical protein
LDANYPKVNDDQNSLSDAIDDAESCSGLGLEYVRTQLSAMFRIAHRGSVIATLPLVEIR